MANRKRYAHHLRISFGLGQTEGGEYPRYVDQGPAWTGEKLGEFGTNSKTGEPQFKANYQLGAEQKQAEEKDP